MLPFAVCREIPDLSAGVAFHDAIAGEWSAKHHAGAFRRRLGCFRSILARRVAPGEVWLDLGCGSGVLTREILALGASVLAVDRSPAMLAQTWTTLGPRHGSRLECLLCDARQLPLGDKIVDGVLCSSVVEYADRPSDVLKEAARVLRDDGKLILSVPPKHSAARALQKLIRALGRSAGLSLYPYLAVSKFEISERSISSWLGEAGMVLERIEKFDPLLPRTALAFLPPSLLIIEAQKVRVL